ncbi:unnamed protein product [Malus baccata var. baccata]
MQMMRRKKERIPKRKKPRNQKGKKGENRGKKIMVEKEEKPLKVLHKTVDWDSPTDICAKLLNLLGEAVPDRYEEVDLFDVDDQMMMWWYSHLVSSIWEPKRTSVLQK